MKSTSIIKSFRTKRLLSQEDTAKLLGITRQTYNSMENDLLNSDCLLMFKLLNIFGLSEMETDEFFNALKQDYVSYINHKEKE